MQDSWQCPPELVLKFHICPIMTLLSMSFCVTSSTFMTYITHKRSNITSSTSSSNLFYDFHKLIHRDLFLSSCPKLSWGMLKIGWNHGRFFSLYSDDLQKHTIFKIYPFRIQYCQPYLILKNKKQIANDPVHITEREFCDQFIFLFIISFCDQFK